MAWKYPYVTAAAPWLSAYVPAIRLQRFSHDANFGTSMTMDPQYSFEVKNSRSNDKWLSYQVNNPIRLHQA